MYLDRYQTISTDNHTVFEFYNEGPKGRLKKLLYLASL